jgi:hypothetical protein
MLCGMLHVPMRKLHAAVQRAVSLRILTRCCSSCCYACSSSIPPTPYFHPLPGAGLGLVFHCRCWHLCCLRSQRAWVVTPRAAPATAVAAAIQASGRSLTLLAGMTHAVHLRQKPQCLLFRVPTANPLQMVGNVITVQDSKASMLHTAGAERRALSRAATATMLGWCGSACEPGQVVCACCCSPYENDPVRQLVV